MTNLDGAIRNLGSRFRDVPGFGVASSLYPKIVNPIASTIEIGHPFPNGYYTVDVAHDSIPPFELWVGTNDIFYRKRVKGTYEEPVMDAIGDRLSEDSVFWEVGVNAGYFSLAAAGVADCVVSFDNDSFETFEKSIQANGFDNITCVKGTVGDDVVLDEYPNPDIALIDIEGWEYEALAGAPSLLESDATLIVEIHDPAGSETYYDQANPEGVLELLLESGRELSEIHRRRDTNYNVLAEPPD